jgi:hypothetical protein
MAPLLERRGGNALWTRLLRRDKRRGQAQRAQIFELAAGRTAAGATVGGRKRRGARLLSRLLKLTGRPGDVRGAGLLGGGKLWEQAAAVSIVGAGAAGAT